jgi:hypothetical protein
MMSTVFAHRLIYEYPWCWDGKRRGRTGNFRYRFPEAENNFKSPLQASIGCFWGIQPRYCQQNSPKFGRGMIFPTDRTKLHSAFANKVTSRDVKNKPAL